MNAWTTVGVALVSFLAGSAPPPPQSQPATPNVADRVVTLESRLHGLELRTRALEKDLAETKLRLRVASIRGEMNTKSISNLMNGLAAQYAGSGIGGMIESPDNGRADFQQMEQAEQMDRLIREIHDSSYRNRDRGPR